MELQHQFPKDIMTATPLPSMRSSPASSPAPKDSLAKRDRLVIGLLLVSAFTVILNETIMSLALPHLMVDLDVTAAAAQWLTTAFLLAMAVVIPITGFLLRRFSTRAVFLMAMSFFCLGTVVCALSPGLASLIVGRVVQACGTAIMMPLLMTTAVDLVPPARRGRTMGNISIVISVAPAIGPTLSGIILSYLDWRWMFWLVLPVGLGALALGYAYLQNVGEPRKTPLDLPSVPLSAVGFGALVYGLSTIGETSGANGSGLPVWLPLTVGLAVLAVFFVRQVRLAPQGRALLDLRTFRTRTFAVSSAMMGLCMMSLFGMIILLPIYLQSVLQLTPLKSGLLLLPGGMAMGLMAPLVGRLFDRIGARKLVIPGSILVSGGLWSMALLGTGSALWQVLAAHMVFSLGLSLLFTPLFTSSLGSLPKDLNPYGSAVIGTIQQVCGAAGIALFVSIMSLRMADSIEAGATLVDAAADGVSAGFVTGALISLCMIVASFFVRRPPDMVAEEQGH